MQRPKSLSKAYKWTVARLRVLSLCGAKTVIEQNAPIQDDVSSIQSQEEERCGLLYVTCKEEPEVAQQDDASSKQSQKEEHCEPLYVTCEEESEVALQDDTTSSLMSLPQEIRLLILEHCAQQLYPQMLSLPATKDIRTSYRFSFCEGLTNIPSEAVVDIMREPGLLLTCKQLRKEALTVFARTRPCFMNNRYSTWQLWRSRTMLRLCIPEDYREQLRVLKDPNMGATNWQNVSMFATSFPRLKEVRILVCITRLNAGIPARKLTWRRALGREWARKRVTELADARLERWHRYVNAQNWQDLDCWQNRTWRLVFEVEAKVSCRVAGTEQQKKWVRRCPSVYADAKEVRNSRKCEVVLSLNDAFLQAEQDATCEWLME